MVSISRKRIKQARQKNYREKVGAIALSLFGVIFVFWSIFSSDSRSLVEQKDHLILRQRSSHVELHVHDPESESYNALAMDVIDVLKCRELLNKTVLPVDLRNDYPAGGQRRLQEAVDSQDRNGFEPDGDDYREFDPGMVATAAHLFCLQAVPQDRYTAYWRERIQCSASQMDLLDLWGAARAEMEMNVLLKTLESVEHERTLLGTRVHFWAPNGDDGLEYMVNILNEDTNADHGGIHGLDHNLGTGRLFVDVGSCLGLTSMAVAILYPGTQIVSVEAAAPSWLLQELNWQCNGDISKLTKPKIMLAGVGGMHGTKLAKMVWRPQSTTSTRSWTPRSERLPTDIELTVKLKPWKTIISEASIQSNQIDVLNVDCEGCEYNLIPALTEEEFDSIATVLGGIHWGYIPSHKLPSSQRASQTHKRLCRHENFARTAKECCDFPDLVVQSSVIGEVLVQDEKAFPPKAVTVKDVGELCDDFEAWAKEKFLHDVESDYGWFQITSMADE